MKTIRIKEGKNWAENDFMVPTVGTIWNRTYVLTEDCLHPIDMGYGINKLWGISGFPYHKRNSVRVCWMPHESGTYFVLYAAAYVNGHREIRELASARPGDRIRCLISNQGNNCSVWINDMSTTFKVRIPLVTYTLPVYFGGVLPAPWDMEVLRVDEPFYLHFARSCRDFFTKTLALFGVLKLSMER